MQEQQLSVNLEDLQKQQNQALLSQQSSEFTQPFIFTPYPNPKNIQQIKQSNIRSLSGIIKQRVKKYLKGMQGWDVQNLKQNCEEVVQYFVRNEGMMELRQKLENDQQFYEDGQSIRNEQKLQNGAIVVGKVQQGLFNQVSSQINKQIMFFYQSKQNKIIVSNAKYDKNNMHYKKVSLDIVKSSQEYSFEQALWFKDRKGDIFAFHDGVLSVFKYHLKQNKMKQIQLRKHQAFSKMKSGSVLYIPQTDKVYYFDDKTSGTSFSLDLYRPYRDQKYFSNCISANPPRKIQAFLHYSQLAILRATYLLQPFENTQIPVIYLICSKQNYLPVPLTLLKITEDEKQQIKMEELYSNQGEFDEGEIKVDLTEGDISVFRRDSSSIVSLYCRINGIRTILEGKIKREQKRSMVDWSLHPLEHIHQKKYEESSYGSFLSRDILRPNDKKVEDLQENKVMLINDLEGVQSNSISRKMVYFPDKNSHYQMTVDLTEGSYNCRWFSIS